MYYTCNHCLTEQGQEIAPLINLIKLVWRLILKYLFGTWETQIQATLLKQGLQCCLLLSLPYPKEKSQPHEKGSSE